MSSPRISDSGYRAPAIALHWIIAAMIAGGFALGLVMSDLAISPQKLRLYAWHKWSGITVLALVLLRVLWRLTHAVPPLPAGMPAWQVLAARVGHLGLYGLMLAIPLSGWLFSSASGYPVVYFGIKALQLPDLVAKNKALADVLKEVHELLNWTLAALVFVHIAAAIKHHWIDRDDTLRRMLPFLSRR